MNDKQKIQNLVKQIDKDKKLLEDTQKVLSNLPTSPVEYHFLSKNIVRDVNKALSEQSEQRVQIVKVLTRLLSNQNSNTKTICNIMLTMSTAEVSLFTKVKEISGIQNESLQDINDLYNKLEQEIKNPDATFSQRYSAFNNLLTASQDSFMQIMQTLMTDIKNGKIEDEKIIKDIVEISNRVEKIEKIEITKLCDSFKSRIDNNTKKINSLEKELSIKANRSEVEKKQNKIEDIEQIRKNATKGATSLQPSDISDWAKTKEKPTYTPEEVGALPSSTFIPTKVSDLENDEGFLTEHQDISMKADSTKVEQALALKVDETTYTQTIKELNLKLTNTIQSKQDKIEGLEEIKSNAAKGATALQPNEIANWAKQKEKPSYTAEEVGALPSSTFIPTKVSDLENDKEFLTEHQDISMKADSTTVEQSLRLKVDEITYKKIIGELNHKLATNQKMTITGLVIGGLSFIGMIAMLIQIFMQ